MGARPTLYTRLLRKKPVDLAAHSPVGREHGLSRSIGLFHLVMLGVGSTVGTGIFFVLAQTVPIAGPAVIISFGMAGLVAGLTVGIGIGRSREREHRCHLGVAQRGEFLRLMSLAQWVDYAPGELVLKAGQQISDAMVLISGEADAIAGGRTLTSLHLGQLIGDANAYSGLPSPVDVRARGPVSIAKWDLELLRRFTEGRPTLRAQLLRIETKDLATKLQQVAGIGAAC